MCDVTAARQGARTNRRRLDRILSIALVGLALLAAPVSQAPAAEPLPRGAERWARKTLAGLSLEQKAAQLVMVRANGFYVHPASETARDLVSLVRDLEVGGVVVFASELETVPRLLNELQAAAEIPLLIAADVEPGLDMRMVRGTVSLPWAMAIGATRRTEDAHLAGEIIARQGRELGFHWAFAPVVDVNNNPDNPVINRRSFGEDPELVASMAEAFIDGVSSGGLLTTAKHFPGHGDTAIDSHLARPALDADRERLESIELMPFRRAIAAGVDSVMTAHLSVPALDPSGAPATLSAPITSELLREEMGFDGLIVTDALEMAGIRPAWTGEAAVRSVQAGADVVLLPNSPRIAVQSLVRAVREGQLTEERLDRSVRRLLETKARLGLHRDRSFDRSLAPGVARPADIEAADEIAQRSLTLLRNEGDVLPLRADEPLELVHVALTNGHPGSQEGIIPVRELRQRKIPVRSWRLGQEVSEETAEMIVEAARKATHVVVSAYHRVAASPESPDLYPEHGVLIGRLLETGTPLALVSLGSPYILADIPEVGVYLTAYGAEDSSQRAVVPALLGEAAISGRLPVTLPGLYAYGEGIELARYPMALEQAAPGEYDFGEVDSLLEGFVEAGAFPGGVLAVGYQGELAHVRPFGRQTWAENSPVVTADTIYDLASLTKVVATTAMAMILVDRGELDLDKPVQDFLPNFTGPCQNGACKEKVTVRHLLTHSSGIVAFSDLYKELRGKRAYVDRIQTLDLEFEPGTKSVYSDFGMILLGEILERVAGDSMSAFLEREVYGPLGMVDTGFLPSESLRSRIAPTEDDPWRGYVAHGEVHDENAHAMGGIAAHAGVFSTATDVARFLQMILNGGVLEHHRIASRRIVEEWTQRAGIPDSDRATGWDTKSAERSSAGTLFSPGSFGHLGYTGTSMWVDPERELFVVLLTNRVHPTRENTQIRQVRPAVADAVVRAIEGE
jgi:beta-glucosidase-like glycosyl hydrolase/CubicO group peptidase (beta-lactamase class C family)